MATLDEIAERNKTTTGVVSQNFADFITERFGIDFSIDENPNKLTTSLKDKPITLVGTYNYNSGWRFSVNGNNFSARGDLPRLTLEQRQDELFKFIRMIGA